MAIRVSPGTEKPHECLGHKKSVSRNGTWFAETIRASDKYIASTGRTQDSTRPRHAETSKKCLQRRSHPHKTLVAGRVWAHLWTGALWQEIYSVICSLAVSGHLFGLFGRCFRYRWPSCVPQDEVPNKSPHLMVLAPIWGVFTC